MIGTGSGSLSLAFARTLAPSGHLYTFDFHQERVEAAIELFQQNGFNNIITANLRDVCQMGFRDVISDSSAGGFSLSTFSPPLLFSLAISLGQLPFYLGACFFVVRFVVLTTLSHCSLP